MFNILIHVLVVCITIYLLIKGFKSKEAVGHTPSRRRQKKKQRAVVCTKEKILLINFSSVIAFRAYTHTALSGGRVSSRDETIFALSGSIVSGCLSGQKVHLGFGRKGVQQYSYIR